MSALNWDTTSPHDTLYHLGYVPIVANPVFPWSSRVVNCYRFLATED